MYESSHLIEKHRQLPFVEKYIMLGLVGDMGGEVLAHYAMPVGSILLVKLLLDMFGNLVLNFDVICSKFGLHWLSSTYLMAYAFISEESGMSMMVSLRGSDIGCTI